MSTTSSKIKLTEGFSVIPEGTHVFKIINAEHKATFGKIEVTMATESGQRHIEKFTITKADGSVNEGAMRAFSFFAKTAFNDFTLSEIEPKQLEGKFIKCSVSHDVLPNKNDPSKTVTFIRLGDKSPASGFESTPNQSAPAGGYDLSALLG